MRDYDDFLAEQLKDPELKKEYDALEEEFALIQAEIDARKNALFAHAEVSSKIAIA